MKHQNIRLKIAILALFTTVLTFGLAYALENDTFPSGVCYSMRGNDGHCVSDGGSYYCDDAGFFQAKNCKKPNENNESETETETGNKTQNGD